MRTIQVLDKETIDKIAAGEVVERPASVIKELAENAIDAKATAITIEIKDGGTTFMRVTDNGGGIPGDQVRTAFLRHATSKIRRVEDLVQISSLGFRGEALSSIAAVAQVECITKTPEALTGTRYSIEGGEEKDFEEIGAPTGTTILVRNLFFNTPARAKFLKTPMTEGNHVSNFVEELALSHPEISFKFIQNGQTRLYTSGNGNLKEIVYQIFGRDLTRELIAIDDTSDIMHMHGFIGKPNASRGNRNFENYFVNGRFVKSKVITKGIEDGYHGFLMQHRYPFTLLYLDIDGTKVDVNVHPQKLEVRLSNQEEIYHQICLAIQNGLLRRERIPEVSADPEKRKGSDKYAKLPTLPKGAPEPFERVHRSRIRDVGSSETSDAIVTNTPAVSDTVHDKMPESSDAVHNRTPVVSDTVHGKMPESSDAVYKKTPDVSDTVHDKMPAYEYNHNRLQETEGQDHGISGKPFSDNVQNAGIRNTDPERHFKPGTGDAAQTSELRSTEDARVSESGTEDAAQNSGLRSTEGARISESGTEDAAQNSGLRSTEGARISEPGTADVNGNLEAGVSGTFGHDEKVRNSDAAERADPGINKPGSAQIAKDVDSHAVHEREQAAVKKPIQGEQMDMFKEDKVLSEQSRKMFRLIGQVFDTYWLIEYKDSLYIIDQHAAHEKVNYERMMKNYREKKINSQMLYPALVIDLSAKEAALLRKNLEIFQRMGYDVEPFGGNSFKINAVPDNLYGVASDELFIQILDQLGELGDINPSLIPERLASMSCKAAVKGNNKMSPQEANALIDELLTLKNPYNCPHGRPTIISMSKYELDRKFKRIV